MPRFIAVSSMAAILSLAALPAHAQTASDTLKEEEPQVLHSIPQSPGVEIDTDELSRGEATLRKRPGRSKIEDEEEGVQMLRKRPGRAKLESRTIEPVDEGRIGAIRRRPGRVQPEETQPDMLRKRPGRAKYGDEGSE